MGGTSQPFLYDYDPVRYSTDNRLPPKLFDPKAITRASFDKPKPKPKPDGPLVSFNVHPDAFPPPERTIKNFTPMGPRSKRWIIRMRNVQLVFRLLQFLGAAGLLVIMIMLNNIKEVPGLVIRIALGVAILHTSYGIYHLWRPAGGRTPMSSTAYHFGVIIVDIAACLVYAFGVYSARKDGATWGTLLPDKSVLQYFIPAVQYGLIGAGGLHVVSIGISTFLAIQFWRICKMPPDMNPLEDNLTSRAHKRNKSSVVSISTYAGDDKRPGTVAGSHRDSSLHNGDDLARPRAIPFMHTRQSSDLSERSFGKRESQVTVDLPERQYQITPGNSPRSSMPPRPSYHGSYSDQVPFANRGAANPRNSFASGRPSTSYNDSEQLTASPTSMSPTKPQQLRGGKFQETWYATESLFNRTHERNRAMKEAQKNDGGGDNNNKRSNRAYEAITDYYDTHDSDDDYKQPYSPPVRDNHKKGYQNSHNDETDDIGLADLHPNPLRSNPSSPTLMINAELEPERSITPFSRLRESILRPLNLNPLNIKKVRQSQPQQNNHLKPDSQEPMRNRDSSIQPETFFFSATGGENKPYDPSTSDTPPTLLAGHPANNRVVSSGFDHDFSYGGAGAAMMGGGGGGRQRHVSGKVAEEGMAGGFGGFSEDISEGGRQQKKRLTVTNA